MKDPRLKMPKSIPFDSSACSTADSRLLSTRSAWLFWSAVGSAAQRRFAFVSDLLYLSAGGDGFFMPGLSDGSAIEIVAKAIDPMPLNVMLRPGLPAIDALRKLGVRRLSAGAAIAQASLGLIGQLAHDFLAGNWPKMFANAADYGTTNRLFDVDNRERGPR